jgi:hypothetical protein
VASLPAFTPPTELLTKRTLLFTLPVPINRQTGDVYFGYLLLI